MIWKAMSNYQKKAVKFLWGTAIFALLLIGIVFWGVSRSGLPSFSELENPRFNLASVVYDAKSREMGKFYYENRQIVPYDSLNPYLIQALLATEDIRYFSHAGIDAKAVLRVFYKNILLRRKEAGGGSTVTQQLAKLLFKRPDLNEQSFIVAMLQLVRIKLKEWATAVRLEKRYTKEEIISMYLNKFDFIYEAHGIQAAAWIYFSKNQKDLNISESAILIGMLKNPVLYNPARNSSRSKDRRNLVLGQMKKYGMITSDIYDELIKEAVIVSAFKRPQYGDGAAPHFRMELAKWIKDTFRENQIRKPDGTEYNIYTDGLRIYTTIDLDYQNHAKEAATEQMKELQQRYRDAWKGIDPLTYQLRNPNQYEMRLNSIERRVTESERYLKLKNLMLDEYLLKIGEKYNGLSVTERITQEMIAVKNGETAIEVFFDKNIVPIRHQQDLKKLLEDPLFDSYLAAWSHFQQEKDRQFNEKIQMKVYTYNRAFEKDTFMTPYDSVVYHLRHLQVGVLAMESGSGAIKAWVGGLDFRYFKYDHINSRRQVGSTFKPVVYAAAIAIQGMHPCQEFDDIPYSIYPGEGDFNLSRVWTPDNSTEYFTGNKYNLYHGMLYSKNSITVKLMKELGTTTVVRDLAHNMGIDKHKIINNRLLLPEVPSIALGAADLSVMEMTGLYGTFANNGVYTKPYFVSFITDHSGRVIYENKPESSIALNPVYNYVMVDMLRNNMDGIFKMGDLKSEAGGKTGTTNDFADGWFLCITPNLVIGAWTGGDEKWVRFTNLYDGQGYTTARPIAHKLLLRLESDENIGFDHTKRFLVPADRAYLGLTNCMKYKTHSPVSERQRTIDRSVRRDEFIEELE
jgi:penicillin-binding protein 1A